jgi:hypothetical protein
VHRHFAVNARRVREIKHGFRGQLSLVMDPGARKTVPVSRRREATVRRALELLLYSHCFVTSPRTWRSPWPAGQVTLPVGCGLPDVRH